jgi:hypothetical protein
MAKGQKRSTKEPRKEKSKEAKQAGPKYLRPAELVQTAKPNSQAPKKSH